MKWMQFIKKAESLNYEQANEYISDHNLDEICILDVRQPSEYEQNHIPGATLIPLPQLMDRISELDPKKPVLVY